MNKTALAILAALSASIALADDFKTIDGKEYKNVTVSRVEPDGLVLTSKSRISKVYFPELLKDLTGRFDPTYRFMGYKTQGLSQLHLQKSSERGFIFSTRASE